MDRLETFRQLAEEYSLIRLNGKIPIEKEWQQYCHIKRGFDEVGFEEDDNAGIACGPASGLLVVDIDDPELFEKTCHKKRWDIPHTRTHQTGSGTYHALYRYPDGIECGNKGLKEKYGFDVRGMGGQIVAPGSIHPKTGKPYTVLEDVPVVDPPEWLLALFSENGDGEKYRPCIDPNAVLYGLKQGERDEQLFRYACQKRRQGLSRGEIESLVLYAARNCSPPFPERDALRKVEQAFKYKSDCETYGTNDTTETNDTFSTSEELDTSCYKDDTNRDTNRDTNPKPAEVSLADKVRAWLDVTDGIFHYTELARDLQLSNTKNIRNILTRLVKENTIERVGSKSGTYRRIDSSFVPTRLFQSKGQEFECILPLNMSDVVKLQPGSLCVVAGDSNAAKTWFLFEFCRLNLDKHRIRYINSEMSDEELDSRLLSYQGRMDLDLWNKVEFGRIEQNYHHHIVPDAVTIIDFIDIHSDFYLIGEILKSIHERVGSGICFVALQKKQGQALGKGGAVTKEKARLYVSLNLIRRMSGPPYVMASLEKVKLSRNVRLNANGLVTSFEVNPEDSSAHRFDVWHRPTKEEYKYMEGQVDNGNRTLVY